MQWAAPVGKDAATNTLEKRLWEAAGQIYTLQRRIQNLRHTHDLLLPRLLSGQVDLNGSAVPVSSRP